MNLPIPPLEPPRDKAKLRRLLQIERLTMSDRLERAVQLQAVLRVWLTQREDLTIGAYWPIKGEFDALPALHRWTEGAGHGTGDGPARRIGLPVMNKETRHLRFLQWYPGCPMEPDGYDISKPKGTEPVVPTLLLIPCVGHGPGGVRLGYGGGFYDRTLSKLESRPFTVGLGYSHGFIPWLTAEAHDIPLDTILTEEGVAWSRPA